jgi:hypothetical protein
VSSSAAPKTDWSCQATLSASFLKLKADALPLRSAFRVAQLRATNAWEMLIEDQSQPILGVLMVHHVEYIDINMSF